MASKEFDYLPKKYSDITLSRFTFNARDMYTYYIKWARSSDRSLKDRIRCIKSAILVVKEIKRTKSQV